MGTTNRRVRTRERPGPSRPAIDVRQSALASARKDCPAGPLARIEDTAILLYANTPAKTTAGVSNKAIIGMNPNTFSFLSFRFLNIWGNKEVEGWSLPENKAELPLCSVTLDPIEE
jgi:hypothetical protein